MITTKLLRTPHTYKKKKGFTIIEVLVSLALIIVFYTIALGAYNRINKNVNTSAIETQCYYMAYGYSEKLKYATDAEILAIRNPSGYIEDGVFRIYVSNGNIIVKKGDISVSMKFNRYGSN